MGSKALIFLAVALLNLRPGPAQDTAASLPSLIEAHKAKPDDWKICNQLGLAYIQLQQLENALEFFQRTVALNPDFLPARKNMATVLWFLGRKPESEHLFRALVKELPADKVPHLYLGLADFEHGRYPDAAGHFEKAGDLAFNNPEVLSAVTQTYLALGDMHDRHGAPEAAYTAYRKAIATAPRSEEGYLALASFSAAHQNQEFALKVLEEGIAKASGSARLRLEQGILHAMAGKRSEAEASFLEAARIEPKSIAAILARGVLRLEQGEHSAAAEIFREAAKSAPGDYRAEYLYATALDRTGNAPEAEVIRALERAIRLKPDSAASHAALGKAYADASRTEDGARELEKALSIEPDNPTALYQLGRLYRKLGRQDDSRRLLERFEKVKANQKQDEWKMVQVLRVVPASPAAR